MFTEHIMTCLPVDYRETYLCSDKKGGCKKVGFTTTDRELGCVLFFDIISNGVVHTLVMMCVYLGGFYRLETSVWRVHASTAC